MKIDARLDARGLLCPLPVLKIRKHLEALALGAVLEALSDDLAARIDVAHFCAEHGHDLLSIDDVNTHLVFLIQKQR